jgi:hypothetical protein
VPWRDDLAGGYDAASRPQAHFVPHTFFDL